MTILLAAPLLVAAGWFANELRHRREAQDDPPPVESPVRAGGYRLISPLLDVELPEGYTVRHEPIHFKHRIRELVEQEIRSGKARQVSVYFRSLLDGPWFGINEKVPYNPASLMKVPVMVAWLKRAQTDPRVLGRTFVFDAQNYPAKPQAIAPDKTLADGHRYTVGELLHYMLSFSDNRAMWLLYGDLRPEELTQVLEHMDVSNLPHGEENSITAKGYSGFFRILFNASYLSPEMSERALELLSAEDFPAGILATVPKGVPVASKFGEHFADGEQQLHEFGIVYHPRGPYILGIMTRGRDWQAQAEIIRDVSRAIYVSMDAPAP
jgi:beta-lactamase class A